MRRSALIVMAAVVGICLAQGLAVQHGASAAGETVIAIDARPSEADVQSDVQVNVGDIVHVRVTLRQLGVDAYRAYQVKVFYDDAVLDFTGLPATWNAPPTDTTG